MYELQWLDYLCNACSKNREQFGDEADREVDDFRSKWASCLSKSSIVHEIDQDTLCAYEMHRKVGENEYCVMLEKLEVKPSASCVIPASTAVK